MDNFKARKYIHNMKYPKRSQLNYGMKGLLCSFSIKEQDCIQDICNLFVRFDYFDPVKEKPNQSNSDFDIEKEVQELNEKEHRTYEIIKIGMKNMLFVNVKPKELNPVEIVKKIIDEIVMEKQQVTFHTFRMVPIEIVLKADVEEICDRIQKDFIIRYSKCTSELTFAIVCNIRFNNVLKKDHIISEVADTVLQKCGLISVKVDLENPKVIITDLKNSIYVDCLRNIVIIIIMDIKRKLRELIAVQATECALHEIDKILTTSSSIQQKNFILELVSEFVFYEKHGTNRVISKLEELLILQKICQYFNTSKTVNQSALFAIMFNKELLIKRKVFFHKLISMSILMPVPNILNATGILMNQLGNISKESLEICDMLIIEYFINYSVCYTYLDKLPKLSPIFTSNFITGLCKLYAIRSQGFRIKFPSIKMLEILTNWLKEYPHLCILNVDCIKNYKNVQNEPAFFGLMKWCVFTPIYEIIAKRLSSTIPKSVELDFDYEFYSDKSTILNQRYNWNNFDNNYFEKNMSSSYEQFFSQIHLCLLNSLQANSSNNQYRLRSHVDQWTPIINEILILIAKEDLNENNHSLLTSLTRLSQFIQLFASLKILDGNKIDLTIRLNNLPQNRYLSTVIKNL